MTATAPAALETSVAVTDREPVHDHRRRVVAILVTVVVAAVIIGITRRGDASGIDRARHLVEQDSRFVNGPKSGATFADVSHILLDDARSCAADHGASDVRCQARSSAAAFTTVSAFALVGCTQPGVFRARQALLDELAGIEYVDRHGGRAAPPGVPAVPVC